MSNKFFVCDYNGCERLFKAKYSLMRHVKSKHLKKKMFQCKNCNKKFSLPHNLKEHEYIHTQSLPYVCGIDGCTQSFRQRGKLCLHRCRHQGYKKRYYKKNAELNDETQDEVENVQTSMIGLGLPTNNYDRPEPQMQRTVFSSMGSMNPSGFQPTMGMNSMFRIGSMMKVPKYNNYTPRMPTLDYTPNLESSLQSTNLGMNRLISNPEMRTPLDMNSRPTFTYESDHSDVESKEGGLNNDDDRFMHPYSSMFRKKENFSISQMGSKEQTLNRTVQRMMSSENKPPSQIYYSFGSRDFPSEQ